MKRWLLVRIAAWVWTPTESELRAEYWEDFGRQVHGPDSLEDRARLALRRRIEARS